MIGREETTVFVHPQKLQFATGFNENYLICLSTVQEACKHKVQLGEKINLG